MKVLITGSRGQLGKTLVQTAPKWSQTLAVTRAELDLSNEQECKTFVEINNPDWVINAGAYTHTSIAIHDALKGCDLPIIEVHLSNIFKRESFRHNSYISSTAEGLICGFGGESYHLAIIASANLLKSQN